MLYLWVKMYFDNHSSSLYSPRHCERIQPKSIESFSNEYVDANWFPRVLDKEKEIRLEFSKVGFIKQIEVGPIAG